jgi:hypothetical protein
VARRRDETAAPHFRVWLQLAKAVEEKGKTKVKDQIESKRRDILIGGGEE